MKRSLNVNTVTKENLYNLIIPYRKHLYGIFLKKYLTNLFYIGGELKENDPLPSIRSLAKDMRISVVTTKRAYDELEREGLIYTLPAKGCFVAPQNTEILKEQNLKKIEEHINEIKKLAVPCKLTKEDIIDMFEILYEQD